jgi:hypothetical protein
MSSGYSKARKSLGHALGSQPEDDFDAPYPLIDIFYGICGEMPMVCRLYSLGCLASNIEVI